MDLGRRNADLSLRAVKPTDEGHFGVFFQEVLDPLPEGNIAAQGRALLDDPREPAYNGPAIMRRDGGGRNEYGDYDGRDGGTDPGSNNMPLRFSSRSGPKVIEKSHDEDRDKSSDSIGTSRRRTSTPDRPRQQSMWEGGGATSYQDNMMSSPSSMMMMGGVTGGSPMMPGMGPGYGMGPGGFPGTIEGQDYTSGPMGLPMGAMMGTMMGPPMGMGDMSGAGPRKPVLHFTGFTLFPPTVHQGPPPVGERPLGCKTIFVGGQPQNMTMDMLLELFTKHGGEVINIRQGKRNFCHVRYNEEQSVDKAMFVSGYRVRIGANIDPPNNGRLRVDFAENRDDQYEFECDQRRRAREARHATGSSTPIEEPTVTPRYSPVESSTLLGKLKDGESFPQAANMLVTWLERGECDKRNSSQFYTMVKSTHTHVKRLVGEKAQCDLYLNQIQQQYRMQVMGLITQYTLIEQVLMSACKQKTWDHFTKTQRKQIQGWRQQTQELRQQQQEELGLGEKGEAEMDLSDEDDESGGIQSEAKRLRTDSTASDSPSVSSQAPSAPAEDQLALQVQALMHQNSVLRNQLETLKTKDDSTSVAPPETASASGTLANEEMETQIKALQHSLLSMQQQLQDTKNKWKKEESMRKDTEDRLRSVESQLSNREDLDKMIESYSTENQSTSTLDPRKADMIGLLSIFLHVHPFGASTEYLWSYMQRIHPSVTMNEIEALMNSYPTIFRQDLFGVGASLEKRWRYTVFSKFSDLKSGVVDNSSS